MIKICHEKFVEMWNSGVPRKTIAETLGITIGGVSWYSNKHKDECPLRRRGRPRTVDPIRLAELRREGKSAKEIAGIFSVTESHIIKCLQKYKDICPKSVPTSTGRNRNGSSKIDHDEFVRLWNSGVPSSEIGRIFDVYEAVVSSYASKHREECPMRVRTGKHKFDNDMLIELWNSNVPRKDIAELLGIHESYVSAMVGRQSEVCKKRYPPSRSKIEHERFIHLWNEGVSTKKIASEFDVHVNSVRRYAVNHRAECPKRKG